MMNKRRRHPSGGAMVLEVTMICIDNSEGMSNGDYAPSRFHTQADAVNLICGAKTQSNPENAVGVMMMAGKGVRMLVSPTGDLGKILACMHGLEVGAEANLAAAIQVAQLALKHCQNKRQQQRIIAFIGSLVKYDRKVLETIGKKLKKNNVALDIVDFGESDDEKPEKLEALLAAVNSCDGSHIVHVPPVKLNPVGEGIQFIKGHFRKGCVLEAMERYEVAVAAFQIALQHNSQNAEVSRKIKSLSQLAREKKRALDVENMRSIVDIANNLESLKTELVGMQLDEVLCSILKMQYYEIV